jgi:hypothetical protein
VIVVGLRLVRRSLYCFGLARLGLVSMVGALGSVGVVNWVGWCMRHIEVTFGCRGSVVRLWYMARLDMFGVGFDCLAAVVLVELCMTAEIFGWHFAGARGW